MNQSQVKEKNQPRKRVVNLRVNDSDQYFRDLEHYKRKYKNFVVRSTGYTWKVETGTLSFLYSPSRLPHQVFSTFNQIKKEAEAYEKNTGLSEITAKDVKFFHFDRLHSVTGNMYCVDITAAYPTTAKLLGYVSEETYKKAMELDKIHRLRVFGMLAKQETIVTYTNGQFQDVNHKRSETAKYFFSICEYVGLTMFQLFQEFRSTSIFWVDGIFCNDKAEAEKILSRLEEIGYKAKIEYLTDCKMSANRAVFFFSKNGKKKFLSLPVSYKVNDKKITKFLCS